MLTRSRFIVIIFLAGITVLTATCYLVYRAEIVDGQRKVDAFWGRLGKGYHPVDVAAPFPAILNPPTAAADEAEVAPDELVLAVVVNGEARAYPLNMMTGPEREIFNDELGGRSIAATW